MIKDFDLPALQGRLQKAVNDDGRSMRSISRAAGCGNGYLHSILVEGKEPRISNLIKLCNELNVNLFYIMLGLTISANAISLMLFVQKRPEMLDHVVHLMELAADQGDDEFRAEQNEVARR